MATDHVYVNGERKSKEDVGGYVHVGPNGKTLGPNMDIELALQFGYTVGLTFVSLSNGDVAVIGSDPAATMEATEGDAEFKAAGEALVEEAMKIARAANPMAALLEELLKGMAGNSQLRAPQPRRGRDSSGGRGFADFLAQLGSSEDCQCDDCKRDRGEL